MDARKTSGCAEHTDTIATPHNTTTTTTNTACAACVTALGQYNFWNGEITDLRASGRRTQIVDKTFDMGQPAAQNDQVRISSQCQGMQQVSAKVTPDLPDRACIDVPARGYFNGGQISTQNVFGQSCKPGSRNVGFDTTHSPAATTPDRKIMLCDQMRGRGSMPELASCMGRPLQYRAINSDSSTHTRS